MRTIIITIFLNMMLLVGIVSSGDIEKNDLVLNSALPLFRVKMLGYSDTLLYRSTIVGGENDLFRHWSATDMGIAFYPPLNTIGVSTDSSDIHFLEYYASQYLKAPYYNAEILDFTKSFWLKNFKRKEFYFDIISNGVPIRFSGWYGHCIHIIIFTEFNSKNEFAERIEEFFNLSEINPQKVSYIIDADLPEDFFCFYSDINKRINIYGYPLIMPNNNKVLAKIAGNHNTALELYISGKEQKDEK